MVCFSPLSWALLVLVRKNKRFKLQEIKVWNLYVWSNYMEISHLMLGNYPNSFIVHVWVRKTLTLQ